MNTYVKKEKDIVKQMQDLGYMATRRDVFNRYCKKIDAYLKLTNQPLSKEAEYFEKYTEDEFDELLRKYYDIKEKNITYKGILKAKPKGIKKEMTEHEIQVELVKYLSKLKIKFFAVPNGFVRGGDRLESAKYMNYMKAEGFRNGAPDLVLLPGGGNVVFLELKTEKGKPSEYQLEWQEFFNLNQYAYKIVYGLNEARQFIDKIK
jgi:hypothetical protein